MTNYDNYGFVNNLTLEMVLNDESPSPYSLKEFIKYLKQTYCTENLDFYRDVTEYKSVCYSFFGPFLRAIIVEEEQEQENHHGLDGVKLSNGQLFYFRKDQEHWLNNEEKIFFHHLIIKFNKIMENYIFNNATKEINIPFDLKQQLLYSYSNQHYHPHILHPAYASIIELLRISAFIPFITDTNRFPLSPSSSTSSTSSSASDYINDLTTSTAIMSITTTATPATIDSNNINNQNKYHMTDPTSSSIISTTSITSTSSQQHLSLPWNPRRLKSSPSLNTSLSTCTTLTSESSVFPPLPKSSLSSSTKNKDKDDSISIHSTKSNRFLKLPSPTSPTSEQSNFFIKKVISSTLKKRPSPNNNSYNNNNNNNNNTSATTNASKPFTRPAGNWTRIQVQDKSIFQQPPKSTTTASMISNNTHTNDSDDIAISFNVPLN